MEVNIKIITLNISGIQYEANLGVLRSFINFVGADIVLLQEVSVNRIQCPGYEEEVNPGTKKRGTAILWKTNLPLKITAKLTCGRGVAAKVGPLSLVNVYAPAGSQGRAAREQFFSEDMGPLLVGANNSIILAGDFNCIMKKNECTGKQQPCSALGALCTSLKLKDAWTSQHPDQPGYTHYSRNSASRLDRFLVTTELTPDIQEVRLHEAGVSDHKAVALTIKTSLVKERRAQAVWKMDPSILLDPQFLPLLRKRWEELKRASVREADVIEWWEHLVKPAIKKFAKEFSTNMHTQQNNLIKFYFETLDDLCTSQTVQEEHHEKIKKVKAAIKKIHVKKMNKYLHSGTCSKPCPDENASLYHLVNSIRNRKRSRLDTLQTEAGEILTSSEAISAHIHEHFQAKFSAPEGGLREDILGEVLPVLTDADNANILKPATAEEVFNALQRSKPRKSPGEDGIPTDFYKVAWEVVGPDLVKVVDTVIRRRRVAESHKAGIMVLVPKVTNATTVKQLRPITLLNADAKLVSRVLEARLKRLQDKWLHPLQVRGGHERNMTVALCDLRDAVAMVQTKKASKACMVSMDLQGAFDNVMHQYLWEVLRRLGFNTEAIELLQSSYIGASTRIQTNGCLTLPILLFAGVRQGCPLSMAFFNLAMSPLLWTMDRRLHGLSVGHCRLAASSYVDDAVAFLTGPQEVPTFMEALDAFSASSGLKVNVDKSKALALGKWDQRQDLPFPYVQKVKILGVTFAATVPKMVMVNWPTRVGSVRAVLADARLRRLDLRQRVAYCNVYVLPLVMHLAQVLPCPLGIANQLRKSIGGFIKAGHLFSVPLERMSCSQLEGGLGLLHHRWKPMGMFVACWESAARSTTPCFTGQWLRHLQESFPPPRQVPPTVSYFRTFREYSHLLPADLTGKALGKAVYQALLLLHPPPPARVEEKYPDCDWATVWANASCKAISAPTRSAWFYLLHDLVPTRERLHKRGLAESPRCMKCGVSNDDLFHRLVVCNGAERWLAQVQRVADLAGVPTAQVSPELLLRPTICGRTPECHEQLVQLLSNLAVDLERDWQHL